jgi:DNA-binding transcriptional regulator YiaG
MARYSAKRARRKARIRRKFVAATTAADIARQAAEDGTAKAAVDFETAFNRGRLRAVTPLDVASIRAKTGLSQDRFARAFQISPHTVRNWEQGRRVPEGPARALLLAIDRDPEALMRALCA